MFFHLRGDHISHKQDLNIFITISFTEPDVFSRNEIFSRVPSQFVVKCESVIGLGTYGGSPAEVSGTSECHYQSRGGRGGALAVRRSEGRGFVKRAGPLTVRGGVKSISH